MPAGFELFDHTADLGIRIFADRPEDLLWPAVQGLYAAIGELVSQAGAYEKSVHSTHHGDNAAILLRGFLHETLIQFERDQEVVVRLECRGFSDTRLDVSVTLAPLDVEKTVFYREVKAITYHELSLEKTDAGYEARVIVDI